MLRVLLDKFWNEDWWLPPNMSWADVTPGPDKQVVYTTFWHVWLPIPFAVFLLIIRYVLEKKLFAPLGRRMGIVDTRLKTVPDNSKLEAAYRANPELNKLSGMAKQLDMTERQVERWWRLRRSQDKPSTLVKFCENMFKATFFLCEFTIGLTILWDKEWLWDIDYSYIGHPYQGITNDVWWYYMSMWTFCTSQIMTLFWEVKRKDFWLYVVHHFATILLLQISWVCNLHRMGTLVIVAHDSCEVFLELAKAMRYAKYQRGNECFFAVFVLLWFITRLGYFPFYIIWSLLFRAPFLMAMYPAVYIIIFLLCILLVLHIFWTWVILQVVERLLFLDRRRET